MKVTVFCLRFHLLEEDAEEPDWVPYVINSISSSFPIMDAYNLVETKALQELRQDENTYEG